ncbi:MAG: glycosyltransferase family 4 protein [Chloroflexi bacterium]|nr:glycosyltransferase family 4 protein [Chloroflexota bacterium]
MTRSTATLEVASLPRVLLTTDTVGGVWDFAWSLAAALTGQGHPMVLLALGALSPAQQRQAEAAGVERLYTAPLKLEWMRDCTDDVKRTRDLVQHLVQVEGIGVVHANQFAAAHLDSDVPVVLTLHSDVLSWRAWSLGDRRSWRAALPEWAEYAALVRSACLRADEIVAISGFLAREIQSLYEVDRRMEVVPNGWTVPPPERLVPQAGRERLSLLAGRAWDAGKNIGTAIEAARRLAAPGRILLAGEQRNPESGGMFALGAPFESLGHVERPRLDALLGKTRVYVSPARYDPFGLLPVQAAQAGCALLLADIPSYREVWGDAAAYAPPDDADALARSWSTLLDDERVAQDLAERAQARAAARYDVRTTATAYSALYARVAARRAARPLEVLP